MAERKRQINSQQVSPALREFDKPNEDCPATNWILQTMMQTYPKFAEEGADLDEEERDEAMLLYATFHQMCFPEETKST